MRKYYQVVDYMIDLRNVFDVRYVFGIITTYDEWRVFWLEDTERAAAITDKDVYDEQCAALSATDRAID